MSNPGGLSPNRQRIIEQRQKQNASKNNEVEKQESKLRLEKSNREKYEAQELKRAPKIQVDQKIVLWSWLIGIALAFVASAIVSFNGITSVAVFVGLSQDWMAGLFFFFIELMYLLFLVAYLVLASRVSENGMPEKTMGSLVGMIAFGGLAVVANAFHTFDYWNWAWTEPRMWAGTILGVAAPLAIIASSKMASRVVFAKAVKPEEVIAE